MEGAESARREGEKARLAACKATIKAPLISAHLSAAAAAVNSALSGEKAGLLSLRLQGSTHRLLSAAATPFNQYTEQQVRNGAAASARTQRAVRLLWKPRKQSAALKQTCVCKVSKKKKTPRRLAAESQSIKISKKSIRLFAFSIGLFLNGEAERNSCLSMCFSD